MICGPVTVIHIYQLDKLDWHEKHRYNHQKLWNLTILIFWPKMTKCQTNLVRKKIFHRFFCLFSSQNHSIRKKKFWKFFHFFENFDPKWPFLAQISTQKAKFDQKHFFRDPEVLRFPTRGHMPMFEKVQFFGPETGRRARILENRSFRAKSGSVTFL